MSKFISFYLRHKKIFLLLIGMLAGAIILNAPSAASAAAGATAPPGPESTDLIRDINEIINIIIRMSAAWLWPVILMIGTLLDNSLIFGGAMGERLLAVWVQVRNLVNIIFVLVLLAIAIYNVLGIGEEGGGLPFALKTVLPKFVLALIAVNFSFLAAKVVLDFTNVVTGAVFALPTQIVGEQGPKDVSQIVKNALCGNPGAEVPGKGLWCKGEELNDRAKQFFSKLDRSNITIAYAIRFGRAPNLKFIKDGLKDIGQLAFNILFNAVLYVVYAVSFIVLFLVLLVRVVVLWIGVVLSPLIAIGIVIPQLKEIAGEAGGLREKFVENAIAPIKIGLVLSIGYIMLDKLEADKTVADGLLSSSTLMALDPNALPTDITDLQQLMIAVGVVVITWVGVFAGAEKTAAKGITDFIKTNMEGFGKWVAKLPTYAQIIPVGKGKMGMAQVFDTLAHKKEQFDIKYGRSPERMYDIEGQLRSLKAVQGNPKEFAAQLARTPGILGHKEGFQILQETAGIHDPNFAAALSQIDFTLEDAPERIARAIRSNKGSLAKEINTHFPDERTLANSIRAGTAAAQQAKEEKAKEEKAGAEKPAAAAPAPAAPAPAAPTKENLKKLLFDNKTAAATIAGKGALKDWTAEDITVWRTATERLPDAIRESLMSIKDPAILDAAKSVNAAAGAPQPPTTVSAVLQGNINKTPEAALRIILVSNTGLTEGPFRTAINNSIQAKQAGSTTGGTAENARR